MAKKNEETTTAAFLDEYKGRATLGIWNVDEDGDKVGEYPLIAFGIAKARALVEHLDAIQEFVDTDGALPKRKKSKVSSRDSEDDAPRKSKIKVKEKPIAKVKRKKTVVRSASDSDED